MAAAVPPLSNPCWARLANGGLKRLKTNHLATQFLVKRLERSTDPVPVKAAEIHAFFAKWERILTAELDQIASI
jgi:hypothetical protein